MTSQKKFLLFFHLFNMLHDFVISSDIYLASNSKIQVFMNNESYQRDLEIYGSDLIINNNEVPCWFVCEANFPIEWTSTVQATDVLRHRQYQHLHTKKFIAELYIGLEGKSRGSLTCGPLVSISNDSITLNLFVNGDEESGFVSEDEEVYITDWSLLPNGCQTVEIPCAVSHPRILPTLLENVNQSWIKTDYINFDPYTGFRKNICQVDNECVFQCQLQNENITITLKSNISHEMITNTKNVVQEPMTFFYTVPFLYSTAMRFKAEPHETELLTFPGQEITLKCIGSNESFIRHSGLGNTSLNVLMQSTNWFDSTMTLVVHKIKLEFKQNLTVTCDDSDTEHSWNIVSHKGNDNLTHKFWQYDGGQNSFKCLAPTRNAKLKNTLCSTVSECSLRSRNFKDEEGFVREISKRQNSTGKYLIELSNLLPFGSIECIDGTAHLYLTYFTGLNGLKYFVGIDDIPDEAVIAFQSTNNVIVSQGQTTELLMCTYSRFFYMRYPSCSIKYENGTVTAVSVINMVNYTQEDVEFVNLQNLENTWLNIGRMIITPEMDEAICGAPQRSNGVWRNLSYKFTSNRRIKYPQTSNLPGIILGVTAALGVATVSIVIVIKILRRRQKKTLDDSDIQYFYNGGNGESVDKRKFTLKEDAVDYALGIPYNDFYELESEYLNYSFQNLIGTGAFGLVFSGSYLGKPVAIKNAKENVDIESFKAALAELKMLMYVGFHTNVVKFVGAVTKNIQNLQLEIVLELCSNGSLNNYLRKHVKKSYQGCTGPTQLLIQQIKWCVDITNALEYLFQRKIIHGDLATRNVLLDDSLTAKLSDFGLSTKSVSYSAYVKKSKKALLPWRWMAVESLTKHNFSTASDIWSFGVVVWEIFTLGEIPYPAQHWDESFLEYLKQGKRLPKPHSCPDEIYEVLLQCWEYEEKSRPNILKVSEIFSTMIRTESVEEEHVNSTSK